MALSARKKKALGFGLSGLAFIAVAVILWVTTETPEAVNVVLAGLGMLANLVGLVLVLPSDVS